jgi:hypothetical protein
MVAAAIRTIFAQPHAGQRAPRVGSMPVRIPRRGQIDGRDVVRRSDG